MIKKKICNKCGLIKTLNEYNKSRLGKDGLRTECKSCSSIAFKRYREKNKEKLSDAYKVWHNNNKERRIETCRKWRINNPEKVAESKKNYNKGNRDKYNLWNKKYKQNNRDKILKDSREYYKKNKDRILDYNNKHRKKKYHSDEQYNISVKIRVRINKTIKIQESNKKYKTVKLLGCDFGFYKIYLESLFTDGMTWELLKAGEIHIDHIIPISSFDLTNEEEQKKAFNYKNTQPLWAEDNMRKGARIIA